MIKKTIIEIFKMLTKYVINQITQIHYIDSLAKDT